MGNILVVGIGTNVGKSVTAAILTKLYDGEYWKPIQTGQSDSESIKKWMGSYPCTIHPSTYTFKTPVSPHHAARLAHSKIDLERIFPPESKKPLIIESAGGIFTPLTDCKLNIDLFEKWECEWVLVSRHYLGSINHTLLTLEAIQRRKIPLKALIFNGTPNRDSESAILSKAGPVLYERLYQEKSIDTKTLSKYAEKWKKTFL